MSMHASGALSSTLLYSSNQSADFVKPRVMPRDPGTIHQLAYRSMMRWLNIVWPDISAAYKASWSNAPAVDDLSDYYRFCTFNLKRIKQELAPSMWYPPRIKWYPPSWNPPTLDEVDGRLIINQHYVSGAVRKTALIWRSTSTPVTKVYGNLRHTGYVRNNATPPLIDQPPAPGTYYYLIKPFGPWAEPYPEMPEVSGTV